MSGGGEIELIGAGSCLDCVALIKFKEVCYITKLFLNDPSLPQKSKQIFTKMDSHRSALAGLESHTDARWHREINSDAALNMFIQRVKVKFARIINQRAPVSRLPNELLAMIFKAGQAQADLVRFEVLVSHVSSRWRNVAINLPSLWTYINIRCCPVVPIELAAVYIERSRTNSLDIECMLGRHSRMADDISVLNAQFLISMFATHIHRWRRFFLYTRHWSFLNVVRTYLCTPAPRLERLSLILDEFVIDRGHHGVVHIAAAPRLSLLSLRGPISFTQNSPSNVETLHLHGALVHDRHLDAMLTLSPCLTHLSLASLTGLPNTLSTIAIPTLRSLRLEPLSIFVFNMLSALEAPQLETLEIHDPESYHRNVVGLNQPQLTSTATKFPNLKSFTFGCFDIAKPWLRQLFNTFPAIEHLSLYNCDDIAISVLGEGSSADTVWPGLHTITIVEISEKALAKLCTPLCTALQLRKELGFPVTKLYLDKCIFSEKCGQILLLQKFVEVERGSDYGFWPPDLTDYLLDGESDGECECECESDADEDWEVADEDEEVVAGVDESNAVVVNDNGEN